MSLEIMLKVSLVLSEAHEEMGSEDMGRSAVGVQHSCTPCMYLTRNDPHLLWQLSAAYFPKVTKILFICFSVDILS